MPIWDGTLVLQKKEGQNLAGKLGIRGAKKQYNL